jgi:hypothetical protein
MLVVLLMVPEASATSNADPIKFYAGGRTSERRQSTHPKLFASATLKISTTQPTIAVFTASTSTRGDLFPFGSLGQMLFATWEVTSGHSVCVVEGNCVQGQWMSGGLYTFSLIFLMLHFPRY